MPESSSSSQQKSGNGGLAAGSAFGRYRIEKQLGEGAMGAVFLAHDTKLNDRSVALKVPKFTGADRDMELQRFHREAGIAATLSHPNLCPVYDVGELDGVHYLAMGFIEGKPLNEVLGGKPLAEKQAAILVRKIALAMAAAHDKGVVHRDLKPANIMMDARKEPIVMDFGLARQKGGLNDAQITQSGVILGTPAYMSPEQVSGELDRIGPPADVYSLGVILYELLTGQRPFQGPITAVLGQILSKEPPPPRQHRPGLDPRLEAITLKAIAKSPGDRYATMPEFAAALAEFVKPANSGSSQAVARADDGPRATEDLSLGSVAALVDAARQCLKAYDYAEAIRLLDSVPTKLTTEEISTLRDHATKRQQEVDSLQDDIADAKAQRRFRTLTPKLERLLKLKPGHAEARRLLDRLQTYGGKYAKVRFSPAGDVLPAARGDGLWDGMGWKYAAVIVTAVVAFGVGLALIYPELNRPKAGNEPAAESGGSSAPSSSENITSAETPAPVRQLSLAELLTSSDYEWTAPENLGPGVNSPQTETLWGLGADERTLYFYRDQLFVSRRAAIDETFSGPQAQGLPDVDTTGSVTADGLVVVGYKRGTKQPVEIWTATRTSAAEPFGEPVVLNEPVNIGHAAMHPVLSDDGLTLLVCTTRPGSVSGDVWMFTRDSRSQPFDHPEQLPPTVNTPDWDMPSFISNDRTVLVASTQAKTPEGPRRVFRVFTRTAAGVPFEAGQLIGLPLGPANDDDFNGDYRLSPDGQRLYFYSMLLPGGRGQTDLYMCRRVPKVRVEPTDSGGTQRGEETPAQDPASTGSGQPAPSTILTSSDWEWNPPRRMNEKINTDGRETCPTLTGNELWLYFLRDGVPMAVRRDSRNEAFGAPHVLRGPLGKLENQEVFGLSITADGRTIVLAIRPSDQRTAREGRDEAIWIARREGLDRPFGEPVRLPDAVNARPTMRSPWISRDGLLLLVTRPSGEGGRTAGDIHQHTRKSLEDDFDPALPLGSVVNTPNWDVGATLSPDHRVLFKATIKGRNGDQGQGRNLEPVICLRSSPDGPFEQAVPLDPVLAACKPMAIQCSSDGKRIYFHAPRSESDRNLDLYFAERVPKPASTAK